MTTIACSDYRVCLATWDITFIGVDGAEYTYAASQIREDRAPGRFRTMDGRTRFVVPVVV